MVKLLAHPVFTWIGVLAARVAALVGISSGVKDEDILNMDAEDWFLISALYMLFIVVSLLNLRTRDFLQCFKIPGNCFAGVLQGLFF